MVKVYTKIYTYRTFVRIVTRLFADKSILNWIGQINRLHGVKSGLSLRCLHTTSSKFGSSSLFLNKFMANCNEMPVKIPNFCLCGTVGIHTHTSIKNPTKNPNKKPHRKSRSVPTDVRNNCGSGQRKSGLLWFKLRRNSEVGPCDCIQESSCKRRRRTASSSSA